MLGGLLGCQQQRVPSVSKQRRPNVLFIAVDDLRPELGCYGAKHIHSPNIDRLAQRGRVFQHAYCQEAICSPSRTSLLTGLRPDSTQIYDLTTHFRENVPDVVTLPQYFKRQGYTTRSLGKIFHLLDPFSWSAPSWHVPGQFYHSPEGMAEARRVYQEKTGKTGTELDDWVDQWVKGFATEAPRVPDEMLQDGQLASEAIHTLCQIKDDPFFLGVGFHRPHLPFVAPKSYWDLYSPGEIALVANQLPPVNVPAIAMHKSGELRYQYSDIPKKDPLSDDLSKRLIHGYYACVSYIDAQVGRLLRELDKQGLTENTIVILWGDHGYHLGDHGLWCKHTNFENAVRAPLIVAGPGVKHAGQQTNALVEFVDIYPTLCELAGFPLPKHLEGKSFAPLLEHPDLPWKKAAFSQYPRPTITPADYKFMGYSVRTERYRLTLWKDRYDPSKIVGRELYDYEKDPLEMQNLIEETSYQEIVKKLTAALEKNIHK